MENKLNLPPFYIGETVEYITGHKMPKGTKVVVSDIHQHVCGCWSIEINGNRLTRFNSRGYPKTKCTRCNKIYNSHSGDLTGWEASSFRSLKQTSYPLMTFQKIVEKETEEILINN